MSVVFSTTQFIRATFFATVVVLTGCAGMNTVVGDVSSFASAPADVKAGNFRFERLPSQEQDAVHAQALEDMAQKALEKAGFKRNDGAAQFSVQVGAWTSEGLEVWPGPSMGRWAWPSRFSHLRPWGLNPYPYPFGPRSDREVFLSKVRLEIRDIATAKVVFEATATNEESWYRADTVLPALFEAALTGFPTPNPTVHPVTIVMPKK